MAWFTDNLAHLNEYLLDTISFTLIFCAYKHIPFKIVLTY
jgi:hypothetical protein